MEKMVRIKFDPTSVREGFATALSSSSVVYTGDPHEFVVPEETLRRLEEKKIPFIVVLTDVSG